MTFKQWIIELFKDERGTISIKPVVAFMGCLVLCTVMVINGYRTNFKPSPEIINAVMIITAIGMGADTFDKFSFKNPFTNSQQESKPDVNEDNNVKE
jgi:hypothetical protein